MSVFRFGRAAAVLIALAGCGPASDTRSISVLDALGRTVSLQHPARRIVSLSPATTELLFEIGGGDRVVGRTRYCDYPPEALAVPSVGEGLNPNVEAVAAARPDLVVMYSTSANARAIDQLGALGIPVVNVPMDRLGDVAIATRLLGRMLGDTARADSTASAFDSTLAQLRASASASGPGVALLVWDNPPIVLGAGSFLDEMVQLAGGHNVFGEISRPSANVNIETIAARNPDMLLLEANDSIVTPAWASRAEWQVVPAVRKHRFGFMRGSMFGRPSLRAAEAVKAFREMFAAAGK